MHTELIGDVLITFFEIPIMAVNVSLWSCLMIFSDQVIVDGSKEDD